MRQRRALVLGLAGAVVATGIVLLVSWLVPPRSGSPEAAAPSAPPASITPTPTPLTPAEALLQTTDDPNACAVSFELPGLTLEPQLQTQGVLYSGLPIPAQDGRVFAGWYASAADAAAFTQTARINGSQLASCADRRITLFGSWMTPEQNAAEATQVPILMYHQFTDKPEGEDGWLRANYAYIGDFTAQMQYVADQRFYLPTWDELDAFIDGRLYIPQHSVIITDDDADPSWLQLAVPVVTERHLLTTSFVITEYRHEPSPSPYVIQRSHTDRMHEAGDNGKGRMVNWSADEIAADLEASAAILGAKEVVAYPYGHYNDTAKEGVREAGFLLARTIDWGYVQQGTDKLALPVIRMNYGDTAETLANAIG
ncbi:MAG: polysaccharide deacetylase family protein [Microbacterium sp.]